MKYEIGSQWKTRGGWRAMVVDHQNSEEYPLLVWHLNTDDTYGQPALTDGQSKHDLVEPWKEPIVHEGYISLFSTGDLCRFDKTKDDGDAPSRIACVPFKYTEGDGPL